MATQLLGRAVIKRCSATRLLKCSQVRRNGQPLEQGGPCLASSPAWHASWIAMGIGYACCHRAPPLSTELSRRSSWPTCALAHLPLLSSLLRLLSSEHSAHPAKGLWSFQPVLNPSPEPRPNLLALESWSKYGALRREMLGAEFHRAQAVLEIGSYKMISVPCCGCLPSLIFIFENGGESHHVCSTSSN